MLPRAIPFPETGSWPPQPVTPWPRPEPLGVSNVCGTEPARGNAPGASHRGGLTPSARAVARAARKNHPGLAWSAGQSRRGYWATAFGRAASGASCRTDAALGRSAAAEIVAAADQSQAEMMQRFSSWRCTSSGQRAMGGPSQRHPRASTLRRWRRRHTRRNYHAASRSGEARRALAEEKKKPDNRLYESLKQQMASLLDGSW